MKKEYRKEVIRRFREIEAIAGLMRKATPNEQKVFVEVIGDYVDEIRELLKK